MSREIKVSIEIKKTVAVTIRKSAGRADRPWDWVSSEDEQVESSEYFRSIEDAIDDAEKVLNA